MADRRAEAEKLLENERVRVTLWRFAEKGAATGFHRHAHDYVVVPLAKGALRIEDAAGAREVALDEGGAYFRDKGVEHDVLNASDGAFAFVETELLEG